jgi:hypothetical protein
MDNRQSVSFIFSLVMPTAKTVAHVAERADEWTSVPSGSRTSACSVARSRRRRGALAHRLAQLADKAQIERLLAQPAPSADHGLGVRDARLLVEQPDGNGSRDRGESRRPRRVRDSWSGPRITARRSLYGAVQGLDRGQRELRRQALQFRHATIEPRPGHHDHNNFGTVFFGSAANPTLPRAHGLSRVSGDISTSASTSSCYGRVAEPSAWAG